MYNDTVIEAARANGLAIILWNKNPSDSRFLSTAANISERITSGAQDGDNVFMHDTSLRSVEATEMAIRDLSAKGFVFVTAEELIRHRQTLVAGKVYTTGYAE